MGILIAKLWSLFGNEVVGELWVGILLLFPAKFTMLEFYVTCMNSPKHKNKVKYALNTKQSSTHFGYTVKYVTWLRAYTVIFIFVYSGKLELVDLHGNGVFSETQQLRTQVSGLLSQQSSSDQIMREIQQREMDLMESIKAKDSQLAVLRVRLQEGDHDIQAKDTLIKELQVENKRLLEGANESSGLHNHALQTLQDRLAEVQAQLDREKQLHVSSQTELTRRINHLEEEQQESASALTDSQRKLEEERTRAHQLVNQVSSLRGELVSAREELTEYKAKAGRILQSKEKLIASLKEDRGGGGSESAEETQLHEAELHQIRSERDLLREELEGAGVRIRQLLTEISDLESSAQDQAASAYHNASNLEEALSDERKRRTEVEAELRHVQEEMRCAHEELTRQKVNLSSRLQERDTEIDRLRKQVMNFNLLR
ncbi:golgin subfamily A member 5-like [Penaeus japonicus]|uniref:golgin subfamily A member 5-like n=1 Tax=Penaeus japonicus TaxID=27405 RepID=UPI001C70D036|nr:golgin subfamily A member 5-like [Penaeus japonicus]